MASRRDGSLMWEKGQASFSVSQVAVAIVVGVLLCCVFTLVYSTGLSGSDWPAQLLPMKASSDNQTTTPSSSESLERVYALESTIASQSKKIAKLKTQVMETTERLRLVEMKRDDAQKQLLALDMQPGPLDTVKGTRTNPTVIPDKSVNPRLAKLLEEVAIGKELIVALANSKVKQNLEIWFTSIKRVGIPNYLVVALDDEIAEFCKSNEVPVYKRDSNQEINTIANTGNSAAVSGLKFRVLKEFLQLGYGVLLSDADVVYLQNPFHHLYRDSDVESMTDGHDNYTAYGYSDVFDEPVMGWSRYVYTNRIWVYNSGFFYIRPTIPSIELLDRVTSRLIQTPNAWDQVVFNEELFYPSHPGYNGLHIAKRTMDYFLFMNSKVLFRVVRKDAKLMETVKPVIVHINYHPDKLPRMKAVVDFFVDGNKDALQPFPDGSSR